MGLQLIDKLALTQVGSPVLFMPLICDACYNTTNKQQASPSSSLACSVDFLLN